MFIRSAILLWICTVIFGVHAQEIDWNKVARGCRIVSIIADGYAEHRVNGGSLEELMEIIDQSPEDDNVKRLAHVLALEAYGVSVDELDSFGNDYYEFCMRENKVREKM